MDFLDFALFATLYNGSKLRHMNYDNSTKLFSDELHDWGVEELEDFDELDEEESLDYIENDFHDKW